MCTKSKMKFIWLIKKRFKLATIFLNKVVHNSPQNSLPTSNPNSHKITRNYNHHHERLQLYVVGFDVKLWLQFPWKLRLQWNYSNWRVFLGFRHFTLPLSSIPENLNHSTRVRVTATTIYVWNSYLYNESCMQDYVSLLLACLEGKTFASAHNSNFSAEASMLVFSRTRGQLSMRGENKVNKTACCFVAEWL